MSCKSVEEALKLAAPTTACTATNYSHFFTHVKFASVGNNAQFDAQVESSTHAEYQSSQ